MHSCESGISPQQKSSRTKDAALPRKTKHPRYAHVARTGRKAALLYCFVNTKRRYISDFKLGSNNGKETLQVHFQVIVRLETGLIDQKLAAFFQGPVSIVENLIFQIVWNKHKGNAGEDVIGLRFLAGSQSVQHVFGGVIYYDHSWIMDGILKNRTEILIPLNSDQTRVVFHEL